MPVDKVVHKEVHKSKIHFANFTLVYEIAGSKGLEANPEVHFARINKVAGGVEACSIHMQDAWQHEFPSLVDGNGMLQDK